MPILLTTPVTTGDLDFTYDRVKISQLTILPDFQRIEFMVEFGAVQESVWATGSFQPKVQRKFVIRNVPEQEDANGDPIEGSEITDFTDTVAELPSDGSEKIYDGASRVVYQWLIDNYADPYAGTID